VRGTVYAPESNVGVQCLDNWHGDYDPNKMILTDEDRKLLKGMKIGV
jgi:hypothetical protein